MFGNDIVLYGNDTLGYLPWMKAPACKGERGQLLVTSYSFVWLKVGAGRALLRRYPGGDIEAIGRRFGIS